MGLAVVHRSKTANAWKGGARITTTGPLHPVARIAALRTTRAASLNSAIGRGLRKSKGVGFRGKERRQPAESYGEAKGVSLVRRTAEPRFPTGAPNLTRDAWRKDSSANFPKRGRSSLATSPLTIRRGKTKIKVEDDDGRPPKTRSRAARFHDPESSFGKKSLLRRATNETRLAARVEEFENEGGSKTYDVGANKTLERGRFGRKESRGFGGREESGGPQWPRSSSLRSDRSSPIERPARYPKSERGFMPSEEGTQHRRDEKLERRRGSSALRQSNSSRGFNPSEGVRYRREVKAELGSSSGDSRRPHAERETNPSAEGIRDRRDGRSEYRSSSGSSRRSESFPMDNSGERRERNSFGRNNYSSPQDMPTSNRPESVRPSFHDKHAFPTSENNPRSKSQSHDDPSSSEPGFTLTTPNRNIPLSVPYTTPASEFLYGASVVSAALQSTRTPRRKLYKLYIYTGPNRENFTRDTAIEHLAQRSTIPIIKLTDPSALRMLDKMSAGRPHNGYILEASPLPRLPVLNLGPVSYNDMGYPSGFNVALDHQSREEAAVNGTDEVVPIAPAPYHPRTLRPLSKPRNPLVLVLDSILDPGNLGSIIRTASFLGVTAIAISAHKSASFSPVVLKASAGASENISLFSVSKLAAFISESKKAGWRVYAGVAPPGPGEKGANGRTRIGTDDLAVTDPLRESPCVLMIGSEGEGLKWALRAKADVDVEIRGSGGRGMVDSLNVSVAAGILCNSFLSGKGFATRPVQKDVSAAQEEEGQNAELF